MAFSFGTFCASGEKQAKKFFLKNLFILRLLCNGGQNFPASIMKYLYASIISLSSSSRLRKGIQPGCVFLCLLVLWGLVGCGSRRPLPVMPAQAPVAAKKIVESAYSQLGARYRSGGNSPGKGFDCSGFVQWAYSQQGIAIPRITADQARTGRLVAPREGLQPADILVFKNGQGPRGLHTGLYTGDGQFIHSPSKGQRVRTESLDVAYWKNSLVGARRLVN